MTDDQAKIGYSERADKEDAASNASQMTEGVGGLPDLDDDERATVGDVDGDNVELDEEAPH
jgi:hypothetical protein